MTNWLEWFTGCFMGDCSKQVVNQKIFLWLWFLTSQVKCTHGLRGANVQTSIPQIVKIQALRSKPWWLSLVKERWCLRGSEPRSAAKGHLQSCPFGHCSSQPFSQFGSLESLRCFIICSGHFCSCSNSQVKSVNVSRGSKRLLFSFYSWKNWHLEHPSGLCKVKLWPLSGISVTFAGPWLRQKEALSRLEKEPLLESETHGVEVRCVIL